MAILGYCGHLACRFPTDDLLAAISKYNINGAYLTIFVSEDTLNWEDFLPSLRLTHNTAYTNECDLKLKWTYS